MITANELGNMIGRLDELEQNEIEEIKEDFQPGKMLVGDDLFDINYEGGFSLYTGVDRNGFVANDIDIYNEFQQYEPEQVMTDPLIYSLCAGIAENNEIWYTTEEGFHVSLTYDSTPQEVESAIHSVTGARNDLDTIVKEAMEQNVRGFISKFKRVPTPKREQQNV